MSASQVPYTGLPLTNPDTFQVPEGEWTRVAYEKGWQGIADQFDMPYPLPRVSYLTGWMHRPYGETIREVGLTVGEVGDYNFLDARFHVLHNPQNGLLEIVAVDIRAAKQGVPYEEQWYAYYRLKREVFHFIPMKYRFELADILASEPDPERLRQIFAQSYRMQDALPWYKVE